jgi:hypothetical protein
MLLSYSVSNFHSFADRTAVSMRLNSRDVVQGWERTTPSGERVTTAMAMVGANGAGKSNLVKAGPFLAWFARDSFGLKPGDPIAFMPHQATPDQPAEFEVEAEDAKGVRWRYVLRMTRERVLHEALYRRGVEAGERFSYVFVRDWSGSGYTVKQQGFGLAESEAVKVRPNVSLISWGKQYGAPMAVEVTNFELGTNLTMVGRTNSAHAGMWQAAEFFAKEAELQKQMAALLRSWDLGLTDVRIDSIETQQPGDPAPKTSWYPMGIHLTNEKVFELPFAYESSGTKTALVLLWRLLPVLQRGGLAFIDELEADLHPHMIEAMLRLFHDEETNPHSAQIVFTCQSPEVLKILQRTQVTFVEKIDCLSSAFRGDEIEGLTSAHNLYAKYMAGALGAVPLI